MKRNTVMDAVRSSVIDLFKRQKEDEEKARANLGKLIQEGALLILQNALEMEIEEFLGRTHYQRGNRKRLGYRNGKYSRTIKTLAGEITVNKPKVRGTEEPFHSEIIRTWQRRCDDLSALIPGLYLEGLSTRDFQRVFKTFWGESGLSRSTISRLNKRLHEEFETWRKRDLSEENILFLFLDGLYAGVRFDTSDKEAVLVAHGYRKDGSRVVLGLSFGGRESTDSWSDLLHDLVNRKLNQPVLVISDGNKGLIAALKAVWPDLPRQRCIHHRTKNILDKVPQASKEEVRKALNKIWYAGDEKSALEEAKDFVIRYGRKYEAATGCLMDCLADCLTFYRFPEKYWVHIRTSNLLERTFREVRRRTKVIGRFPTESSALAVIYGVLTINSPKWRGLKLGEAAVKEIEVASKNVRENPIQLDFIQEVA